MKPSEIVEMIKKEDPDFLGSMPEQKAARIIREALKQLAQHVDAVEEGVVKVPGFGNFRINNVEREKEGQKVKVRRVVFNRAKAKSIDSDNA